jgi:hypothetical protein
MKGIHSDSGETRISNEAHALSSASLDTTHAEFHQNESAWVGRSGRLHGGRDFLRSMHTIKSPMPSSGSICKLSQSQVALRRDAVCICTQHHMAITPFPCISSDSNHLIEIISLHLDSSSSRSIVINLCVRRDLL